MFLHNEVLLMHKTKIFLIFIKKYLTTLFYHAISSLSINIVKKQSTLGKNMTIISNFSIISTY